MIREILKIKQDKGLGAKDPTFKDIELTSYQYKATRMGMSELTATLKWPYCLDKEWTGKEYVTVHGERFFIKYTPSSEKNNSDSRYNHKIEFTSENSEVLGGTYFVDAVQDYSFTHNKPCSNSTNFTFYGTIKEFVDRLNCAFLYAGIGDSILKQKTSLDNSDTPVGDGYCASLDTFGSYDPDKTYDFSFEKLKIWDAITKAYEKTEIPFEIHGKHLIFGSVSTVVDHTFQYGHDNELLSVTKDNEKTQSINRITMLGSDENIPFYYPNETEYGHIDLDFGDNRYLTEDTLTLSMPSKLVKYITQGSKVVLGEIKESQAYIQRTSMEVKLPNETNFVEYNNTYIPVDIDPNIPSQTLENRFIEFKYTFETSNPGVVTIDSIMGQVWRKNESSQGVDSNLLLTNSIEIRSLDGGYDFKHDQNKGKVELGVVNSGTHILVFAVEIQPTMLTDVADVLYARIFSINYTTPYTAHKYYWECDSKTFDDISTLGINFDTADITADMIGEGFTWVARDRLPFQSNLMPPIYRKSNGNTRFYNAINNTYIDPDTGKYYTFKRPYNESSPSEHIYENENVKPTIEGIRNSVMTETDADGNPIGQLFGVIADIAYDKDDNDSLKADASEDDKNDSLKYEHSFFYIKLNVFNGPYGFNLFQHASQNDAMTLQMRSGNCNGCKFKIQVLKENDGGVEVWKNPVQTDKDTGNIVEGNYTEKVNVYNIQEWQQNTQSYSIWVCVQKDAETFGVIMPNQSNNYKPKIGDSFNIINITLPFTYIQAAEKRLEDDGIRFMADNNDETFSFGISASRIFLAEHLDIFEQINEYSKIKVLYNNDIYQLYVNEFSIDCNDNEALPNVGISLVDKLSIGQSYSESVAERAATLVANAYTLGGYIGGGGNGSGGLSPALAEQRYLNKQKNDRTPYKLSTDTAFEVGEYVSGASGGMFFINKETGASWLETDYLKVRMKSIFEELVVSKNTSIGGEQSITPGGSIVISFVESLDNTWRCYFKASDGATRTKCMLVVGDQVKCNTFNVLTTSNQNHFYWRLVTAVNNDESYIELSKSDCASKSDDPQVGDNLVQLGNRTDASRQSAIVLSTVDATAPCVTLYNNISSYSLSDKAVIAYGVDYSSKVPKPFFHCYGDLFIGPKSGKTYLDYNSTEATLRFKGRIESESTIDNEPITKVIGAAVQDVDTLFIESTSNITPPDLPVTDSKGIIVNYNGWSTTAPTWRFDRYIWQTTYMRDGNGNSQFSPPTCVSGKNGADGNSYTANYLIKSYNKVTNDLYLITKYKIATPPVVGNDYTITIWGELAETKSFFSIFNSGAWVRLANLNSIGNGKYQATFKWQNVLVDGSHPADDSYIYVYAFTIDQTGTSTIERIKLEEGNNPNPEWTPAPSEMLAPTITEQYYLSTSNTELIGDTWHDAKPTWISGRYYWTRSKIAYQNGDITYTDAICVTGSNGVDAYILDLDNEVAGIACDANGIPIGALPTSAIRVYSGTSQDSGWTFSIKQNGNVGCTAAITDNILTITSITADKASVTIQATKVGADALYATMNLYKVKPGETGVAGSNFTDNLYLNSAFSSDANWFFFQPTESIVVADNVMAVRTSINRQVVTNKKIEVKAGEKYTISGWIKANKAINLNYCYLLYTSSANNQYLSFFNEPATTEWNFFVLQFTAKIDGVASPGFGYSGYENVTLYLKGLKWERGFNNAPVWNPAMSELSAVIYSFDFSVNNISRSALGVLSTNIITVYKYKTVGNDAMTPTTENKVRYRYEYNGVADTWTSVAEGVESFSIAIPDDETLTALIIELYNDDIIYDRERIPVISEGAIPTENLVRNSELDIKTSEYLMCSLSLSEELIVGQNYTITIWGHPAENKTYLAFDSTGNVQLASLKSISTNIYSAMVTIPVSMSSKNKKIVNIYSYPRSNTNISTIDKVKIEHGVNIAPLWTLSPADINYLKEAMKESTTIDGGLILASLMQLGYTSENGEYKTMAGVNGIYAPNEIGGGLYTWGGGDMIDPDGFKVGTPSTSGIRHDGTAYFCNNVVRFRESAVEIGDNVRLDNNGLSLITSNNTAMQIGNISVGDILSSTNFNETLTAADVCSCLVYLYEDNLGSLWPVGVGSITPIKNTPVPKGTILSGNGSISILCGSSHVFAGTVILEIYVGDTIIRSFAYNTPNVGNEWDIPFTLTNIVIPHDGVVSMRIRWGNELQSEWTDTGDNPNGTVTVRFSSGSMSHFSGNKTVNGNDGILAVWGNSTFLCNNDEVRMRCGSFGFRVTNTGFQKFVNGTWINVNI